jgi:hypothetical protein
LFAGEANEICRAVIKQAKAGCVISQRLCVERIAPPLKAYPLKFKIPPLNSIDDAKVALSSIVVAVGKGAILSDEAATLASIISSFVKTG